MKRRISIGVALLICTATLFAQNELPNDSIKRAVNTESGVNSPLTPPIRGVGANDELPDIPYDVLYHEKIDLNIVLPVYVRNQWITPKPGTYFDPFIWDYTRAENFHIFENTDINTYSLHQTLLTMGTLKMAGANYVYSPNGRWSFSGGIYVAQYGIPNGHMTHGPGHGTLFDAGVNGSVTFWLNDYVYLKAMGQYSFNGERNSKKGYMPPGMYPQSSVGGVMGVMFNENFGFEGGANYEYNPMKRKWEAHPVFGPVIHIKKKRR